MSEQFAKLAQVAEALGLTVTKTPGGRYVFTRGEEVVGKATTVAAATEFLQERLEEAKAAKAAATQAPAAEAAPAKERKAKAPRKPRAVAPMAGQPVPTELVVAFRTMPNGVERAQLLRQVVENYGRQAAVEQLGVSATRIYSQLNTLALVERSEVVRGYLDAKRLSWTQVLMKISFNVRKGLEYQEQLAHQLAA
jgi:threonine dehydrogenase-like Zn-dependent dehydrogenase